MAAIQSVMPVLQYADVQASARWLCQAFGFVEHHAVPTPDGGDVGYIELRLDGSLILLCPATLLERELLTLPGSVGGANTQTCYLTVADIDDHCRHAQKAGARIVQPPTEDDGGQRYYACCDPEGHLWTFGSQAFEAPEVVQPEPIAPVVVYQQRRASPIVAMLAAAALATGGITYLMHDRLRDAVVVPLTAIVMPGKLRAMTSAPQDQPRAADRLAAEAAASEQRQLVVLQLDLATARAEIETLRRQELVQKQAVQEARNAVTTLTNEAVAASAANLKDLQGARGRLTQLEQQLKNEREARVRAVHEVARFIEQSKDAHQEKERDNQARLERAKSEADRVAEEHRRLKESAERSADNSLAALAGERSNAAQLLASLESARREIARLEGDLRAERGAKEAAEQSAGVALAALAGEQSNMAQLQASLDGARQEAAKLETALRSEKGAKEAIEQKLVATQGAMPPLSDAAKSASTRNPERQVPRRVSREARSADDESVCTKAIASMQANEPNRIALGPHSTGKLCDGAEESREPAFCYGRLMRGTFSWGGGTLWEGAHALRLCAGTRNSARTLNCFAGGVDGGQTWRAAIEECRAK